MKYCHYCKKYHQKIIDCKQPREYNKQKEIETQRIRKTANIIAENKWTKQQMELINKETTIFVHSIMKIKESETQCKN